MLRCAGLCTCEVDDVELALSQIQTQLSEKIELLENTVGVIVCHMEFVDSGALRHVAENLPFDVAGITTTAQAVNDALGEMMLSVFVMTSDTVRFKAGMAESVAEDIEGPLRAAVDRAGEGEASAETGLVLAFPPMHPGKYGDLFADAWGKILPGVPVFGSLSVNDYPDLSGGKSIFRGEALSAGHSFILCYGDVNPRFLIATLPSDDRVSHKGEITRSTANVVHEINGRSAREYLKGVGFTGVGFSTEEETSSGSFWFIPFLVNQRCSSDYDGVPVVRGLDTITKEGSAIFGGRMDEGAVFTLMSMTTEDVGNETATKLQSVRDMPSARGGIVNGVLAFSCVVRHMIFMHKKNRLGELDRAKEALADAPFMVGYAGGELCPTSAKEGAHVNRYHEYSLVALVL